MNRVIIIGRLTADPELKFTPGGTACVNVRVAVDRDFKPENGEREADFIPVTVWGKSAENLAKYMGKGRQIGVEGRLQIRSYDKDGQRHWMTEVIANRVEFLGGGMRQQGAAPQAQTGYLQQSGFGMDVSEQFTDRDLPF